jgi:hypothetical protein
MKGDGTLHGALALGMLRSAVVLALVTLPFAARAQTSTPGTDAGPNISPAVGVHYGSPLRASGAFGMLVDFNGNKNDGIIALAEVGQQGGQASLGYFRMFGWFGSGYSVRLTVLRTGDDPWNATEHTTYLGAELHGMLIFGVGGKVGFLRRASRVPADPHETIVPFGISIGF